MTDDEHPLPSDAELIRRVRTGDSAAYERLFVRHRDLAIRYARRISDPERAEDLCAEAFTKILDLLQRGKGPDVAFRAYLLTTIRTCHLNTLRTGNREELVADHEPTGRMLPHTDDPDARFDASAICRAFDSLPARWRTVLWLTSVEGLSNDEAGDHLGVKGNAVASLAFRARAGLGRAFLSEHLLETTDPHCRRTVEMLPSYLRDSLTPRRRAEVDQHLGSCTPCAKAALELSEVNGRLGALLAPLLLAGAVTSGATAAGATTATVAGVKGFLHTVVAQAKAGGAALSGSVATTVAVAATVSAIGLAVGVQVASRSSDDRVPPQGQRTVQPEQVRPVAPSEPSPSSRPAPIRPAPLRVVTESSTPSPTVRTRPPAPAPERTPRPTATPTPFATPTASATPTPTPTPSTTPPATTPPQTLTPTGTTSTPTGPGPGVAQPTSQSYLRAGIRWEQVTVPVTDPPENSFLRITATRTLQTDPATTDGTGWLCSDPVIDWFDLDFFATSTISCLYAGKGDGSPILLDYQVAPGSVLTVTLTPPSGYSDPDPGDNQRQLVLRDSW